jgi:four helix bundle protein
MKREELKARTKAFALRVLSVIGAPRKTRAGRVIVAQLARCSASVGANHRAARRGRSRSEFVARLVARLGAVLE